MSTGVAVLLRPGTRGPLPCDARCAEPWVATAIAATVFPDVTAPAGSALLREVEQSAHAGEVAAAQAHGHGADGFAIAFVCLLVVVLATVWSALRPGRARWSAGMWAGAVHLTATAVAPIVTGGQVLDAVLDAAALKNVL